MSMRKYITICEQLSGRNFGIDAYVAQAFNDIIDTLRTIELDPANTITQKVIDELLGAIDAIEFTIDAVETSNPPPTKDIRGRDFRLDIKTQQKLLALKTNIKEVARIGLVLGRNTPIGRIIGVLSSVTTLVEDVMIPFNQLSPEVQERLNGVISPEAKARRQAAVDEMKMLAQKKASQNQQAPTVN